MRNILLIEPNYKNKYPPIGLMKLATYHRMLGDYVRFYKGDLKEFVLDEIVNEAIKKLNQFAGEVNWIEKKTILKQFIKTRKKNFHAELIENVFNNYPIIEHWLEHFKNEYHNKSYFQNPKWDRVCITTLFTFHWKITIETINFAKDLVKDKSQLFVGGVLASILHEEVFQETGIKTHKGLLDKSGILDNNDIIIDDLPLDYSILYEIDYQYPENNGYYGYMTRGCKRKCSFCAVWRLEPTFKNYVPLKDAVEQVTANYGQKRNLLLLDNNVLASNQFETIIGEIKDLGFAKGSKFSEPNYYEIAINNLQNSYNDYGFSKRIYNLLQELLSKSKGDDKQLIFNILTEYNLLYFETTTKANILKSYNQLAPLFVKYRNTAEKLRYIDFNQGVDARFITEEKMRLLGEIAIRPLRIAFDNMKTKDEYIKSIKLAAKYKIRELSNYLLYNFDDEPVDLYRRLELNVNLCEELNMPIFSFPMKYLPIDDVDKMQYYKYRNYIGVHWNRKYLRAVQAILNSTKGKIGRGVAFFKKAFGKDEQEFHELLLMPETYLIFRYFFENKNSIQNWREDLYSLNENDRATAINIISHNDFNEIKKTKNKNVDSFLNHYTTYNRDSVLDPKTELGKEFAKFKQSGLAKIEVEKFKQRYENE